MNDEGKGRLTYFGPLTSYSMFYGNAPPNAANQGLSNRQGAKGEQLEVDQSQSLMSKLVLSSETENTFIDEINRMVDRGQIIQIKDKFRMPYSSDKNTISSCINQDESLFTPVSN
mmetsp:Transcript_638/g.1209  ORF Transcript_638/g.1209 Transcript_638/m.1209 type:complete len:115 (-) Transcript_638:24-368(-)